MNRSMEAHAFLVKKGFNVDSYGTGEKVKLPGPAADRPNVYEFGLSYEEIHSDLKRKDKTLYTQNGILHMLDRNRRIKYGPQRLQESEEKYDIIFTAEERVYDQVVDHFNDNCNTSSELVHVVNIDIQDKLFEQLELLPVLIHPHKEATHHTSYRYTTCMDVLLV